MVSAFTLNEKKERHVVALNQTLKCNWFWGVCCKRLHNNSSLTACDFCIYFHQNRWNSHVIIQLFKHTNQSQCCRIKNHAINLELHPPLYMYFIVFCNFYIQFGSVSAMHETKKISPWQQKKKKKKEIKIADLNSKELLVMYKFS